MEFLSDEWCQAIVERSAQGDPIDVRDVVVEVQLTGAPRGRGRITLVFGEGRVTRCAAEPSKDAELKLKTSYEDAQAIVSGSTDPSVAFMRGDLKTDGPTGPLLALLAAWRQPDSAGLSASRRVHGPLSDT